MPPLIERHLRATVPHRRLVERYLGAMALRRRLDRVNCGGGGNLPDDRSPPEDV